MRKSHALIALVAVLVTAPVFADNGGEGQNTGCNGVGNVNSPCGGSGGGGPKDGNGGGGGGGGAGGAGGDATAVAGAIGVGVGIASSTSTSLAVASSSSTASAVNNNTVTNTNSATGGEATATAEGGSASVGDVTAVAAVESGAVTVAEGAVQSNLSYTYKEVKQAPAIGQGSFAIYGCNVGGNAGASGPGWAGFLGFGFTPEQCYDFMLAQAYQSIGEKKAVCDILRNSKAGKRQEKRGITLPECLPEAPQTVVVPVPVDLSPYAT